MMVKRDATGTSLVSLEKALVAWTGQSGRLYSLTPVLNALGALAEGFIYVLEASGVIGWAGTADDLIADPQSRARFRQAQGAGARLLSLPAPHEPAAIMTLAWDLEGGFPSRGRCAA